MSNKRYADEFKIEAVKQVTDRGHAVADVATRLGVSQHSLYQWIKQFGVPPAERAAARSQQEEVRRLKSELRRVTDITYIRTHEGWLYLAAVLDLFSRQVIGWSMQSSMDRELAINALMMAVWRRQPKQEVIVHSDQGSQFSSHDWQSFLKTHNLIPSMSRRGNCHDNAVAESFFQLLKRERIRRRIYADREEARRDVFDYIEMFYNPKRRHSYADGLSPVQFEQQYFKRLESV